jgi:hypothetical protein
MIGNGFFGDYGGQFVTETLVPPLTEFAEAYNAAQADETFTSELDTLLAQFVGRPTPITRLRQLGTDNGTTLWLKREDLTHTGAHKINNSLGQALLARRMGRKRIVAETGAGQHGVAVSAVCAYLGLDCVIYMGAVDARRQAPNLQRMRLLARTSGSSTRARARCGRRSTPPSASGSPTRTTRTTCWVRPSGRTRSRRSSPSSSRSSAGRRGGRSSRRPAACRTRWWPVSAAAATRSACSGRS